MPSIEDLIDRSESLRMPAGDIDLEEADFAVPGGDEDQNEADPTRTRMAMDLRKARAKRDRLKEAYTAAENRVRQLEVAIEVWDRYTDESESD